MANDQTLPFVPGAADLRPGRTRLRLGTVLALVLGGLMLLGVGSVLLVSLGGAGRNTASFLRDKADLILSSIEERVRQHLDPVKSQAEYVSGLIAAGTLDPSDASALETALRAALAATPQVTGIAFISADGHVVRATRETGAILREDWSGRPQIMTVLEGFQDRRTVRWGAPVWSEPFRQTILPLSAPVHREGRFLGLVVPALLVKDLSRYVAGFSTPSQTAFILYGRGEVIAHPALAEGGPGRSAESPLPRVEEIFDGVMGSIWSVKDDLGFRLRPGDEGHVVDGRSDYTVFIHRQIEGYGDRPWIIGAAIPGREADQEFAGLRWILGIGLVLLLLALLSALLVARRIARPLGELVDLTQAVQRLDLRNVPTLPRSRISELDRAGQALNGMVAALRWFELYLPRRLVHALLARGDAGMEAASERSVSILFTDICGFSSLASRLTPAETADLLNEHFSLVGACVEAEHGTIDKYIGDSVMAFWGAPDLQPDHAERACRTALAIALAVRADNERRAAAGLDPIRIRIGISSGTALVGNIGAKGRVNYTLVGDTVNLAQRLEQLGKEIDADADVVALITEDSHACLANRDDAVLIGRREVRGRAGPVGIYRLA